MSTRVSRAIFGIVATVALAVGLALSAGCSEQAKSPSRPLALPDQSTASAEANALVASKWPAMRAACPGLDKYSDSLSPMDVEDNFAYAPDDAQRVTVSYGIAKDEQRIPTKYAAFGHTCLLEVSRDGSRLLIAKSPCQAVCLDRPVAPHELKRGQLDIPL